MPRVELMEPRCLMAADPLQIGAVYIEEDLGSDEHGDTFIITFSGGAQGTQLKRLIIDTDLNEPGFGLGDLFFDTVESGLGADHAFGFQVERLTAANSSASVRATVTDGTSRLILDFTNFSAGDELVFSIDVDEVQSLDPNEADLAVLNEGFDPITSGVEFQRSLLKAEFEAPHYENIGGQSQFLNRYDSVFGNFDLNLPADNANNKRDRSAGAAFEVQQVPKPISLSGTVFRDNNEDLSFGNSESGISSVRLELYRWENGQYVTTGHSTLTTANGSYRFGTELGLQPGNYQVREIQPSGYYSVGAVAGTLGLSSAGSIVPTNPDVITQIDVPLGDQHVIGLNFAENLPASISGNACYVVTGFDCFSEDSVKAPLADIAIELRNASGAVIDTTRTLPDGSYRFDNLRAGTYSLTQINPLGLLEGDARVGTAGGRKDSGSRISQILIGGGVVATGYDFCEVTPSELSGRTYFDQNNNGIRDPSEAPLANVAVQLWDDAGKRVAQTQTDVQGRYRFTNLYPGTYRISEATPAGYIPGRASVGTIQGAAVGQALGSGDEIVGVVLPAGSNGKEYNFGELLPGSISGRVIADTNGNCIIDAFGEMPLRGVTIELLSSSGSVLATTQTNADGLYRFEDLLPGNYTIREVQAAGYFHGGQRVGNGGGDASQADLIRNIELVAGVDLIDYDFCEIPPASISGSVYVDADQDSMFDPGEAPISGVTIMLLDPSGNLMATTTTDSNGDYQFSSLKPGQYSIRESQPAGYFQGGQRAGSGGGVSTTEDLITGINILPAAELVEYDFFEFLPGSISGIVFADLNLDCVFDAGEAAIGQARVDLLNSQGRLLDSRLSDSLGRYSFSNLRPGVYSVFQHQPDGYFQGGQTATVPGANTSQVDTVSNIVLGSGQVITQVNFCEVPPAQLSGYVFQDGPVIVNATGTLPEDIATIRDGKRTSDDRPISGVTLQLRLVGGERAASSLALPGTYSSAFIEVQTDVDGYYHFAGLRNGVYHVFQVHPEDYMDSLDTPGSTGGVTVTSVDELTTDIDLGSLLITDAQIRDAILNIRLGAGEASLENNFSEVLVDQEIPFPVNFPAPQALVRPDMVPPIYSSQAPLAANILRWDPLPLLVGFGRSAPPTWHLSVINGGFPRGIRNGEPLAEQVVADNANRLDVKAWTVRGLKSSTWRIVSTQTTTDELSSQRMVFDLPGAVPLTGDFNGDGYDELALFLDGEWFIDINGNGRWDEADVWLKIGTKGDQPVVGDWDGDGKDDVGTYGSNWVGDERALVSEAGLPNPENMQRQRAKNLPPTKDEAPDDPRLLKRSQQGQARADLIDHVFRFGSGRDIAVAGDFNGDGVATIGVFRNGRWTLDIDGDGRLNDKKDRRVDFGGVGDLPLVGDFDGDGIDELAIVRGNQVIVDSNGNGHIDATDQVFMLNSTDGTVIVGDFDGDGSDEPGLHQSIEQRRTLEARRHGL